MNWSTLRKYKIEYEGDEELVVAFDETSTIMFSKDNEILFSIDPSELKNIYNMYRGMEKELAEEKTWN